VLAVHGHDKQTRRRDTGRLLTGISGRFQT
jgi:hypothetical protein